MKILVVPTIREDCIQKFLNAWEKVEEWDHIIIIEDNPHKKFKIHGDNVHHYSWKEIDEELGANSWIISKRDSAIRSFGFLKAYQMDAEYIFTLDDDCYPVSNQKFIETHIDNLEKHTRWTESVLGKRTRGIPYDNLGVLQNVVMNLGLWEGVPDYDSVQCFLQNPEVDFKPPMFSRIMPRGQYFPFCGMNFCFKKDVTPLCYFPLMGKDQPYNRFDDIWFGIIAKKICDHLNLLISCGMPFVHHTKASNKYVNLEREASGIKINEHFWEYIDSKKLTANTTVDCMHELGIIIQNDPTWNLFLNHDPNYRKQLGKSLCTWALLFK